MHSTDLSAPPRPPSDHDVVSFHTVRPRLFGIAYRVTGSTAEADDVVQDTWLRWQRADRSEVQDPASFLATTTRRLAINVIQSAHARHETATEVPLLEAAGPQADPLDEVVQHESLRRALRTLLARLSPVERAAYVLRMAFDYPHGQVARLLGVSEDNARQIVLRARRRLAGGNARAVDAAEEQQLVAAFVDAAERGALAPLEHLLLAGCGDRDVAIAA
jgi:RNA polymerase sigma-70 factor (ECF subfamily)